MFIFVPLLVLAVGSNYVVTGNDTDGSKQVALPSCSTAATSKLLYDSTAATFSCGTDESALTNWKDSADNSARYSVFRCSTLTATGTSYTCAPAITAPALGGTGSTATAFFDTTTNAHFVDCATGTTINQECGQTTTGSIWRSSANFGIAGVHVTGADLSSQRIYLGVASASGVASQTPTSGATAVNFIAIAYASDAATANWYCCAGDGTSGLSTCNSMGAGPSINQPIQWAVDKNITTAATVTCSLKPFGGTLITGTATTNLPTGTSTWGACNVIRTLTTASRSLRNGTIVMTRDNGAF